MLDTRYFENSTGVVGGRKNTSPPFVPPMNDGTIQALERLYCTSIVLDTRYFGISNVVVGGRKNSSALLALPMKMATIGSISRV